MIAKSLAILAVAIGVASAASVHDVHKDGRADYYNCKGLANGNYQHPWECTKFISCSNGYAYEMSCADCNPGDPRCPDGKTNFNEAADACLWPDEAQCTGGPPPECEDDCDEEGDCKSFRRCEGGKWINLECGEGLWWNNDRNGAAGENSALHGGICSRWEDLTQDTRDKYLADETCIPTTTTTTEPTTTTEAPRECEWFEIGACSDGYVYNHPVRTEGRNVTLNCPGGLLWDQASRTCANCWDVTDSRNGEPCCPRAEVPEEDETKEKYSCIKDGIFKNERDCRAFWKCLNGTPAKINCPEAEVFKPINLVCEPEEISGHFCAVKL